MKKQIFDPAIIEAKKTKDEEFEAGKYFFSDKVLLQNNLDAIEF